MKLKHSKLPLALGLVLLSGHAQALGLGQIEVKSGLNQPLLAEIPVLSATAEELESLEVRLASPEAFARVGLERPFGLAANLEMTLAKDSRGQPIIKVTTSNKFNEPFLTFLLEASWGKGGVVREFSALVDPPYIAPAIIRPLETPAIASDVAPVQAPPPEPREVAAAETVAIEEPAPAPVSVTPEAPAEVAPATPVVVTPPAPPSPTPIAASRPPPPPPQPIAAKPAEPAPPPAPKPVAPAPPRPVPAPAPAPPPPSPAATADSFGPVSAGQTLWSIAERTRPDASVTVNQMMLALQRANPDAFIGNNINRLKRGAVLRIPAASDVTSIAASEAAMLVREQASAWQARRAPAPQPATALESLAKPAATAASKPAAKPADQARLAIVPPATGGTAARNVQSGASAAGGGTELRAELSQAKAQLTQAKEDLAAREAEVRELTSRVSELEQQQADRQRLIELQSSQLKAMQERLVQLEAEKQAAGAAPAPAAPETPVPTAPEVAEAESAPATVTPAEPTPEASTPPPVAQSEPAAPADASPWYMSPAVLGGAGVAVLLALWLAMRGRRKPQPAPSRRISEDDALAASLASKQVVSEAASASAADAPMPASPVADERDEIEDVEPIAAELGGPESAPAVEDRLTALQRALDERPADLDAHLAVLRELHARGDAMAFEVAAAEMHAHVGSEVDSRWREAVVLGVSLAPRNPLFSSSGWNAPKFAESAPAASDEDWREADTVKRQAVPDTLGISEEAPIGDDIAPLEGAGEDWDRLVAELPAEPDVGIEIGDLGGSPDVHRAEAEVMGEDEGSATKIELAKAYLEIGDADGARAMLEEVLAEGGPAARAEAERLLKEIG